MILQSFWDMGGYAMYIWPAYGVSFAALIFIGFSSYKKLKTLEKRLHDLENLKGKK